MNALDLPFATKKRVKSVKVGGRSVAFAQDGGKLTFARPVRVKKGQSLKAGIS